MTVRLRHVAAINPSTPEFELVPDTAELPFLPLEAVWPGDRLDTTRRQPKAAVSSGYTRFREGDILLPKITPTFQADRTVIAIGLEGGVGAGTTELHVVRAGSDADVRYLRYLLSSKKFLDEGEASMIGVAGQKRVPDDYLRDLPVPVVDLRRQRAIADYLDRETARIDALIEQKQRMKELLQERRQTLITEAISRSHDPGATARGDGVSWRRCRLDWLTSEERGAVNPTEISADTVFHYSIPALDEIGDGRLEHPDEIGSGKLLLSGGEVLISKLNPRLPRVLLAEAHDVPTLASTEFIALRPGPNVDERFLRYWLGSEPLRQMLNGATMSVTRSQQRVRPEIVTKSWLRVPSIDDQRSIADYLDRETARIDALIDKKRRLKELLQERRQTLITEAISRSHDPGTAARGDAVTTRRLKHLASIAVSNVDKKTVSDERSVRLCNYTDVYYNERITAELPFMEATASADQIASFGLRADDVLLTKDSETPDDIAVPAYVVADLPDVVCGYHLALLRPSQEVDGRYLFWALGSRSSREQFSASANGITRFGLRYDSFGEVLVPLPPIATQRAIADYLDRETARIDALVERIDRQVALLQERRQALITAAVTGELEIPGVAA